MQAVKHELGASFPLAPCREEEWGGFPPPDGLQPLQRIAARGQRGGSTEGTRAAPPPLPVRLRGCQKAGPGKDEVAVAFASRERSCSWVGGKHAGGAEPARFGTNRRRFCNAGCGRVSRPQGCPGLDLSPLHVARGRWRSRTWFECGFAACAACQRAALLSRALPSCGWLFLALFYYFPPPRHHLQHLKLK